ncbi:MAG TPA: glycerophosphodiester phosphodiesterase family protein, partial [Pirellulaceae bacterium]|nr:glycerophosphodiester phosphodiesterase family protein [Pirellulaceae bacterium]
GHEFLKPRSVAAATIALTRSIYTDEQLKKQTSFYGLGWSVSVDGMFSHGGSDGTFAWADPRRELLGIVFTQSPGGKTPTNEFIARVNESCEPGDDIKAGVVGHRGLLRESPENTLASFRDCLERRIGFELDVRRSRDGHLVCLHDDTLDRTTDGKGPVGDRTLEELRKLDAGGWFHASFRGEHIPTLDEVFALAARYDAKRPVIAIDLKGDDAKIEADVVALANKHSILDRLVIIGRAIDHAEVRQRLKAADAKTPVACLAQTSETFAAALADSNSDWLYLRYAPSREEVATAHAKGKRLFLSGVQFATKQSENWRRAAVRGVDAILTDDALDLVRQLRDDQFRLQQTRAVIRPYTEAPAEFRGDFGKYSSPLKFADGSEVRTADEWQRRRREIHADWTKLLGGDWPPLLAEPKVKIVATEKRENFTQHKVELEVLPGDRYAAGHLLIPDGTGPFPAALVTFYESNTSVGLGERGKGTHDYGLQLARRGFVTLSIGTPGSLEFPGPKTRELLTEAGEQLDRQPLSILAYVAASGHTALARHASVDPQRIGVIGLSYGGKWSMFASLLDQRFACAVWSDPGIVFDETNGNVNYWEPWYLGYERGTRRPAGVPNAERPRTGLYKRLVESNRDMHELHSLMAPRPVLVSGGTEDPPRNWRALNHLVELNRRLGYEGRVAMTARKTHVPTPEALELELQFLELHLKYQ